MQSRREWLVTQGLAKPGRGKFSSVAKQALDNARANGMKFSDDEAPVKATAPAKPTGNSDKAEVVGKTDPKFTPYLTPDEFRFPEENWKAVGVDGKTYSMRECCNLCRVSLVGHGCDNPTILGGISVKIVAKKA